MEVSVVISWNDTYVAVEVAGLSNYAPDAVNDVANHARRAFSEALLELRSQGCVLGHDDPADDHDDNDE